MGGGQVGSNVIPNTDHYPGRHTRTIYYIVAGGRFEFGALGCARNRLSNFDVFYRCCCYPPTSYILKYAFSLFSVLKQSDFGFQLNRRAFVDRYATV